MRLRQPKGRSGLLITRLRCCQGRKNHAPDSLRTLASAGNETLGCPEACACPENRPGQVLGRSTPLCGSSHRGAPGQPFGVG